jgi:hypothetical protein
MRADWDMHPIPDLNGTFATPAKVEDGNARRGGGASVAVPAYSIAWKISGSITQWDENTFRDCNDGEQEESWQEHADLAKQHDTHGEEPAGCDLETANAAAKTKLEELVLSVQDDDDDDDDDYDDDDDNTVQPEQGAETETVGPGGELSLQVDVEGEVDAYGVSTYATSRCV